MMFDCAAPIFERMHFLLGFEKLMIALVTEPKKIALLADMLSDFVAGLIHNVKETCGDKVHGLYLQDDLGTQESQLMSTTVFNNIFRSRYAKIIETAHKCNIDVWLHSDGMIYEILQEFIDIGLDVFDLQQPDIMGIDTIAELFKGKICFHTLVDIQDTMYTSPERIIKQARELVDKWNTEKGGFIAYDYGDPVTIGIPPQHREVAFESFMEFGGVNKLLGRKKANYLS
jgi:uroporphyrinogen decarboxylase